MKTKNQRKAILDLAENLLREKGYNGWSYQDIASVIGIKKASIHYYFRHKEDLGCELIRCYFQKSQAILAKAEAFQSAKEKLGVLIRLYGQVLDHPHSFCLFGMLTADLTTLPKKMQSSLIESYGGQKKWISQVLEEGVKKGEFSDRKFFDEEAALVVSALQGILLMARLENNPQAVFFRNSARFLETIG